MKVDGNAKNRRIAGDRRIAHAHPIAGAIGVRWVLAERLLHRNQFHRRQNVQKPIVGRQLYPMHYISILILL